MEVEKIDGLAERIIQVKNEIAELQDQIESKKESIKGILAIVGEYFIESGRTAPYKSPSGTLFLKEEMSVLQPRGAELKALFEHFEKNFGTEVAWQKMTINNMLLKSEVKQHWEAVEERGGDPILEPLPGVQPPKKIKTLQFIRKK